MIFTVRAPASVFDSGFRIKAHLQEPLGGAPSGLSKPMTTKMPKPWNVTLLGYPVGLWPNGELRNAQVPPTAA